MPSSSWLIGAINFGTDQDVTVNANGETITAGTYYLRSSTASLSLLVQFQAAMLAAGVTNPSVFLTAGRRVRITADANFTITWVDSQLRDALGFDSNVAATMDTTADQISPLLWSPGWDETPAAPAGVLGIPITDTIRLSSPSGLTQITVAHHTARLNDFSWDMVAIDRVWTTAELGGEFRVFYDSVLNPGLSFYLYRGIAESDSSSSAVIFPSGLGPYRLRSSDDRWYERGVPNADLYSPIALQVQVVNEYD